MSASSIGDALITMFGAASAFGSDCGYTYKPLESSSGSCLVVGFSGFEHIKSTMGGGANDVTYTFSLEMFIKEKAAPTSDLKRISQAADTIIQMIETDPTIQDTVQHYTGLAGTRDEGLVETSNHLWWRVPFELTVEVWADDL